jgi:DNA polymerase-3 subunit beta
VRRSAGVKDTRTYLNGIHWVVVDGKLRMESTDGHRATRVEIPTTPSLHVVQEGEAVEPLNVIVPTDALAAWSKLLSNLKLDAFSFGYSQPLLWLQAGPLRLQVSPIAGTYPDMGRVIPPLSARPFTLSCKVEDLQTALALADIATGQSQVVSLEMGEEELQVTGRSEDRSANDCIPAQWNGKSQERSFNIRYLRDAVDSFREWEPEKQEMDWHMGADGIDSVLIRTSLGSMVVMPVRV